MTHSQVGVFEEGDEVSLSGLLEGTWVVERSVSDDEKS